MERFPTPLPDLEAPCRVTNDVQIDLLPDLFPRHGGNMIDGHENYVV